MKEKVKVLWKNNKDNIKNITIAVLLPVAVIGGVAINCLNKIVEIGHNASEEEKKHKEEA